MDFCEAAVILAKEVAWRHREFPRPNGVDPAGAALHCDLCRALAYIWRHPKPVIVQSVVEAQAFQGSTPVGPKFKSRKYTKRADFWKKK